MALDNSIKFVKQFIKDSSFRRECYSCNSKSEMLEKLDFTEAEFEDAINMQLVKCQTYEDAAVVKDIKTWFNLFEVN